MGLGPESTSMMGLLVVTRSRRILFSTLVENPETMALSTVGTGSLTSRQFAMAIPLLCRRIGISTTISLSNYHGTKGVDNDDGSSWYQISYNFMVFGWIHKSNFGGHSKSTFGNLGAYVSLGMRMQRPQVPEYVDGFFNNTIVLKTKHVPTYIEVGVDTERCPTDDCYQIVGNNSIFTDGVVPNVQTCAGATDIGYENWLAMGHDMGTTLTQRLPSNSEVVSWAKTLLSIESLENANVFFV